MDMVAEEPEDETVREVFRDIKTTLDLPNINSDYRTLALWPVSHGGVDSIKKKNRAQ